MKRLIKAICFLLCTAALSATLFTGAYAKTVLLGDCNNDEKIDTKDSIVLTKKLACIGDVESFENADVNCSGKLTVSDLLSLKKYLSCIITDFSDCYMGLNPLSNISNLAAEPTNIGIAGSRHYIDETPDYLYARNVWDMQVYRDKVYFGLGNYDANTGNAPVYYLTKQSNKHMITDYLSSESIENLFVIDDKLYAIATDPTQWMTGYFYEASGLRMTTWNSFGLMPNGVHCYDMVVYKGNVFFGGAFYKHNNEEDFDYNIGVVQRRPFDKLTDSKSESVQIPFYADNQPLTYYETYRCYNLFVFNDELYAIHYGLSSEKIKYASGLYKYSEANGGRFDQVQKSNVENGIMSVINNRSFNIGNEFVKSEPKCRAITQVGDKLALICNGIFVTNDLSIYTKVSLGDGYESYVARDQIKVADKYYICASQKNVDGTFTNAVFETDDFSAFRRVLFFDSDAFVRSFEYLEGTLYFGCGCNLGETDLASGTLFRLDLFDE